MAAMEKLIKALETLKLYQTPSVSIDHSMSVREKLIHCSTISDSLCGGGSFSSSKSSSSSDFAKYLTLSMEMFFSLSDDSELEVRMCAEENINRVIRALTETHVGRLQVELYKEIKKNGPSRCLRSALTKFGQLAHYIRPQKCRAYVVNLLPSLVKIARRQEESVHESLAQAVPKVFRVLGHFANDNEIRLLLKTYIVNLFDSNAAIRRTTAVCIAAICSHCRKPNHFLPWLLGTLLDFLVPISYTASEETPVNRILGILLCARHLLPALADLPTNIPDLGPFQERCLQLYELTLHYLDHPDHNVVTASLETLQQLLKTSPQFLKDVLTSPIGLDKSYILAPPPEAGIESQQLPGSDGSRVNRMSSLIMDEEEESLLDLEPSIGEEQAPVGGQVKMMLREESGAGSAGSQPQSLDWGEDDGQGEQGGGGAAMLAASSPIPPKKRAEEDDAAGVKDAHAGKLDLELLDTSSLSSPQSEEDDNSFSSSLIAIGRFCDTDIPLIYCARKITSLFLLTKEKGVLTPREKARVSVKVLAFGCLNQIFRLSPKIFLLTLAVEVDEEDLEAVLIRDVINYDDHEDPQIKGCVAIMLGTIMRGSLIESGGDLALWFNGRRPDHVDILERISILCQDDSSITLKLVASSIIQFIKPLLLSPECSRGIQLLGNPLRRLASSGYWLLKVELCELIRQIPFKAVYYATGKIEVQRKLKDLLMNYVDDEDGRVRSVFAKSLPALCSNLFYPQDDSNGNYGDPVIETAYEMAKDLLDPILWDGQEQKRLNRSILFQDSSKKHQSKNVQVKAFRVVDELFRDMVLAKSHAKAAGCLESLAFLATSFHPVLNTHAWGCHSPRVRKGSSKVTSEKILTCPAFNMLETLTRMLSKNSLTLDIAVHANIMKVATKLLTGLLIQNLKGSSPIPVPGSSKISDDDALDRVAFELLAHCGKIFAILTSVLEESPGGSATAGGGGSTKSSSSLSGGSLTSPVKMKPTIMDSLTTEAVSAKLDLGGGQDSGKNKNHSLGHFGGSSHYAKIRENLRSIYNVHKQSMEEKHFEKLRLVLSSALTCLSSILELSVGNCIGKNTEELLGYLKTNLSIEPLQTLNCVQCLLRSIFKTNTATLEPLDLPTPTHGNSVSSSMVPNQKGLFYPCFDLPYNELVHTFHLARDSVSIPERSDSLFQTFKSSSSSSSRKSSMFKALGKSTDRAALASYIRLFEPMVIRALKHYTLTSDVEQQSQVLQLLVQLVQLRVNYCLLDSDQIFIGYVIKQLELIEDGQILNANLLIPNIFRFLVLLSYEKYHSKPIIDIPKILRLCEGLFASGQVAEKHVLPALIPVAEDLFCNKTVAPSSSSTSGDAAANQSSDLEAQREVVLNMMLKLIVHAEALDALIQIMIALKAEAEEKWRKISRTIADVVIPLLVNHKIALDNKPTLDLLRTLLSSLAPGCLRPVDPLLAAVLTCSVDLSNIKEVQRWLGFVVIALPTLTNQSPEEGILGRLEELGIQIGSCPNSASTSMLLETSMESTASSTTDPLGVGPGVKPEVTIAKFLIHVIGAACSKFHQIVYSHSGSDARDVFLLQELSHLLLFVSYMFQSGRYVKVTRAAQSLARNGDDADAIYSIPMISELFLQLAHSTPYLTLQWLYILILLNYCPQSFWSRVLAPDQRVQNHDDIAVSSGEVIGLHHEVLRTGGLILYCDILCDNTSNVECTTWLVVNYVRNIVRSFQESPVQDFVMTLQSSASSSGLFLQAIVSRCEQNYDCEFLKKTLDSLESCHVSHNGKLLLFLVKRFLLSPMLSLARKAHAIACRRLEHLLKEHPDTIRKQLKQEEIAEMLELLRTRKVTKRYGRLVGLLNRLSLEFYDLSPIESDELRTFQPGSISNITVDRDWYLAQVRSRCCHPNAPGEVCANLLNSLNYSEILSIMSLKDFNLDILGHCFSFFPASGSGGQTHLVPKSGGSMFNAARDALWQNVKEIVDHLPTPFAIYSPKEHWDPSPNESKYAHRLESSFHSNMYRHALLQLMSAYSTFLETSSSSHCGDLVASKEEETKISDMVPGLARFGILAMEYVKWMLTSNTEVIGPLDHQLNCALRATAATFKYDKTCHYFIAGCSAGHTSSSPRLAHGALNTGASGDGVAYGSQTPTPGEPPIQIQYLTSAVLSLKLYFQLRLGTGWFGFLPLPPCFSSDALAPVNSNNSPILATIQLQEIFTFIIEKEKEFKNASKDQHRILTDLVLGLSRIPLFTTYLRIPPSVWKMGLSTPGSGLCGTTFPVLDVDFLQEIDVLTEYVVRANKLGWGTRQQFEEIWVSLLGVISISKDDLSDEEVKALSQCSSLVVQALTSIILQTTCLPKPGQANISRPIHHARDSPPQFLLSPRGQQLTSVQNLIQSNMERSSPLDQYLQVDCSLNLERCSGGNPDKYGLGQVGVSYIMSAVRHFGDEGFDSAETRSNKSTALSLPFLLREESLQATGLDVQSCLRFLFELYSSWLSNPSTNETPLNLLTETIRSMLMLSDLFSEVANFTWMQECFLEVQRVHPPEDDVMGPLLCLGLCKSIAITGCDSETLDRTKKNIDFYLRSSHLPSKVCGLYGVLYILQSEVVTPEDVMIHLLPTVLEYLNMYLQSNATSGGRLPPVGQCEQHVAVMWAVSFYLLENFEHEIQSPEWCSHIVQLAISTVSKSATPHGIYLLLLSGLERLIVSGKLVGRVLDQVVKLTTDLLTETNPALVIPAIQLFLACMYSSTSDSHISIETPSGGIQDPERLMQAMEQMSIIFDCVRRSGPTEAKLLCEVLPRILVDFFPAADVINRVISEFISPGQPHQILLSGVLFSVFKQAADQDQTSMLQEWVLMALPNFTQRLPVSHSVWCLACFFISAASHSPTLQALYPQLQHRFGWLQHEDKKLFCLAAREFYANLTSEIQRMKFRQTFEVAADEKKNPYQDLLNCLPPA